MLYQLSYSRVSGIVAEALQGVKAGRGQVDNSSDNNRAIVSE